MSYKNNPCFGAALEYIERGWSIIPVGKDKKPLINWKEYQTRLPSEDEVYEWFEQWPDANIGIVTGSESGLVVIDCDGTEGAKWAYDNLPLTSLYAKTGRENGCHCYFKVPVGSSVQSQNGFKPSVDVKAEGGYVVAPPSLHANGKRYEWVFRDGLDPWKDMPELNPFAMKTGNLCLDLSGVIAQSEKEPLQPGSVGTRNETLASIVGKLVGKVSIEEANILALGWNAQNRPPMGEKEVRGVVASIYKTHLKNHPAEDPQAVITGKTVQDEILAAFAGDETEIAIPTGLLEPGGILQKMMGYIDASSAASIPLFNLGAAACLLGALAGQRVMTETELRTNLYVIALGYSGSGKNAPVSALPNLLRNSDAAILEGATELSSAAAVLKTLASKGHHRQIVVLDEIGMLLRGLRNPMDPRAEIPRMLTKLFSGTNRSEKKVYADEKLNFTCLWHHLSVYGASTPEEFWASMREDDMVNGFMARILVIESRAAAEFPKGDTIVDVPEDLQNDINSIWAIEPQKDPKAGNLQVDDDARPMPYKIRKSQAALEIFEPFARKYHELKNDHRGDSCASSIYARVAEHTSKLALIHAVSKHGPLILQGSVGPDSLEWAMAFAEYCCKKLLTGIRDNVACSEWHSLEQRVVRAIKSRATQDKPGLSARDLAKNLHLPESKFNELLKGMVTKGMVFTQQHAPKRGPVTPIFCVPANTKNEGGEY